MIDKDDDDDEECLHDFSRKDQCSFCGKIEEDVC